MVNLSLHSRKEDYREIEFLQCDSPENSRPKKILIVNTDDQECDIDTDDYIRIIRKNGKEEEYKYLGECTKYTEFGHWYFTCAAHNPYDYCNLYTCNGRTKYLELEKYNGNVTHIDEERIEKIIKL